MPGDLAKASIVHIAPSESMTSIVHQGMSFGSSPPPLLNPCYKKILCQIQINVYPWKGMNPLFP